MITDIGSTLSFPFRVDARGSLAVARTPEQIAREAIIDLIECRPGDRVLVPRYGVGDYVFSTVNAGFRVRLAYQLRQQILDYVPSVEDAEVTVEAGDRHEVTVNINYLLRGGASHSFTYPLWQLRRNLT